MLAPPPRPRTLEAAFRDVDASRAEVRASAVADLARHASNSDDVRARVLPRLTRSLQDASPIVRSAAAVALADLRASEALPALLVAIEDEHAHVRQMALNALGEIGDARAAPRIRRALRDPRPDVRYQAILAFPKIARDDPAELTEAIRDALDDRDAAVLYIAIRIAEEWAAAASINIDSLEGKLRDLLGGSSPQVALASAILLARRGNASGKDVVLRVVRGEFKRENAPEKEDEREAIELAGECGWREAVPPLERRAWGVAHFVRDTCAWNAKIALARLGHPRALDEIAADLQSKDLTKVEAAVVAAGRAHVHALRSRISELAGWADAKLVTDALAILDRDASNGGLDVDERANRLDSPPL